MPCQCATAKPDYPANDTWGPLLWTILHGLAERVGSINPMFANDEKQRWLALFAGLPMIIPCKDCREHAVQHMADHPVIPPWKTLAPEQRKEFTRTWFYEFHEAVNARLRHASFDKDLLTPSYGAINIREYLGRFAHIVHAAIQLDGVQMIKWRDWNGIVIRLLALYGI